MSKRRSFAATLSETLEGDDIGQTLDFVTRKFALLQVQGEVVSVHL